MKKIKAIIFDMDGVIVDSEKLHFEAERKTCRQFGINAPREAWDEYRGRTARDFWDYLVNNFSSGPVDLGKMVEYNYRAYLKLAREKLELIPGVIDFIELVRGKMEKLAVATSGKKISQEMVFNKFALHGYFDAVVTGDMVNNGKPHPEPYLKTANLLRLEPFDCMVIEDSTNGIVSAKAAGCHAVGITTTFDKQRLKEAGADRIISYFEELLELM